MKIKAKEKTVKSFTLKLSEKELYALFSDVYDALGITGDIGHTYPALCELGDALRAKGKPVYFAAKPYVEALGTMQNFDSRYFEDGAEEIVIRLLGNLSTWRGETATRVKAELKAAVNHHNVSQGRRPIY